MDIIEIVVFYSLLLVFPLTLYLFYVVYANNKGRDVNDIVLEICLFTSLYLCLSLSKYNVIVPKALIGINLPLLILILKNRKISSLIMIVIIGYYYITFWEFSPILIILEYLVYYLIYLIFRKKKFNCFYLVTTFCLIKTIVFSFEYFYYNNYLTSITTISNIVINLVLFYCLSCLVLILIKKTEEMVMCRMTLKQIENSNQINDSLFKITHEIKNPIAVCKGYLEMLDPKNQKQVEKYIPIIKQEIERTLFLMDDFRHFANQNMEMENLDIIELLDDVCSSLKPMFEDYKLSTNFNILDEEIIILGDYNKLKQVFVNVLKNSIEAIADKKGGYIKLHTKIEEGYIVITILDNGGGVDEAIKKKIFDPFFTTKKQGTGLGLPLSKDIVEKHHGTFNLYSKKGSTAKVIIELPLIS